MGASAELWLEDHGPPVPIFRPRKDELVEPLKGRIEAQDRRDREEHWRLLYVALTRAEERLYVGGALGPADRSGPPRASWYAAIEASLSALGADWKDDPLWVRARRFGDDERPGKAVAVAARTSPAPPAWSREQAPAEERPPRPLAPSSLGEDDSADPPPPAALREAAERGRLLHALFERLPGVAEAERSDLAGRWLEHGAGVADPAFRRELVEDACRIIADPRHSDLFGPAALAEAPIAAVVGDGIVVSGTVDRLLIEDERILFADFKTGRRIPSTIGEIPIAHLRQMAAYAEALKIIFPGRAIEANLLYTSGPLLHVLPPALLERHLPGPAAA
jgi:ATP-dependent helicase/nuclease subunit A